MRKGKGSVASWSRHAAGLLTLLIVSACSLGTDADDIPTSVRVRVEGTSPHQLTLVTAKDLYEEYNLSTGEMRPVAVTSDTVLITLPFDQTMDISSTGSIYVELRNYEVAAATVRLRVELDNGEGDDRTATLSDDAALVYYFIYTDYSYR
ncbi:MAG TPA: hypothetical protein VLH75_08605 [Longimicrobiales bacterium]|nr:hypothetical protein [Longimicrobiales bacterium]